MKALTAVDEPVRRQDSDVFSLLDGIFNSNSQCLPLDALSIHSIVFFIIFYQISIYRVLFYIYVCG